MENVANFNNEMDPDSTQDTEPTSKVMMRLLDDMERLGLIELFKANALGGGRAEQIEPKKVQTAA